MKNKEIKDMMTKEYCRSIRKILKTKLSRGNTIQTINQRMVSIIRYRAGIVERGKSKLKSIDRKIRKLLTMCRSLHPMAHVDKFCCERKNGEKRLISAGECIMIEKTS